MSLPKSKKTGLSSGVAFLIVLATCAPESSDGGDETENPGVEEAFRQRCELSCTGDARRWDCPVPATCVSDCIATTAGLENLCGLCVASISFLVDNGDGTCSARPGVASSQDCEYACARGGHRPRSDFRAECEVDCRIEGEDYGCEVPLSCVPDCMTMTFGLETLCGKCVADDSRINKDATGACEAFPGDSTGIVCGELCAPGTHSTRPDFRAECEVGCRLWSERFGCPMPPSCIDDCVVHTQGLETQCGKCIALNTTIVDAGNGQCRSEPGDVDRYPCSAVCAQ